VMKTTTTAIYLDERRRVAAIRGSSRSAHVRVVAFLLVRPINVRVALEVLEIRCSQHFGEKARKQETKEPSSEVMEEKRSNEKRASNHDIVGGAR